MVQTRRKNVRSRSWPCEREDFQCMSALPRWADIAEDEHHVRKVPILLQKSAATDGSAGHFAKDDRL